MGSIRNNGTTMKGISTELIVRLIEDGNLEELENLLPKEHVDVPLKDGWSALLYACMSGHYDIIKYLLDCGSKADQDCGFFTALMAVCSSRHVDEDNLVKCALMLTNNGADVDAMDEHKTTALMIACRAGRKQLVSFLLSTQCDVNKIDNDGMTALHLAVTFNRPEIVQMLLDNGAVKDIQDRRGRTPLNAAVTKGLHLIIEMLQDPDESEQVALPQIYLRKKTSFEEMLAQLPSYHNSSGKDGFYKEVDMLLGGMGLDQFVDLFHEKKVSLSKLLNITNKELKELGVRFSTHRSRIMKDNLKYIQHSWSPASLPIVRDSSPLNLVDIARSMANTTKHLHILWASSLYCTERVALDAEGEKIEDIFCVTSEAIKQLGSLRKHLQAIHHHASTIEKVDKVSPVDLILPHKISSRIPFRGVTIMTVLFSLLAWKLNILSVLKKCWKVHFLTLLGK